MNRVEEATGSTKKQPVEITNPIKELKKDVTFNSKSTLAMRNSAPTKTSSFKEHTDSEEKSSTSESSSDSDT